MTLGQKMALVNSDITIYNWVTIAIAALLLVALIISIVLTVKMKRKSFFVWSTFILMLILGVSCGADMIQRKHYSDYQNQINYFCMKTHFAPNAVEKVKYNTFEKAIHNMHKADQMLAKRMQNQQ